tara:strand:- start:1724 stop:2443 length:720 start_codon:yes stop_codon:yes gene_type:complete
MFFSRQKTNQCGLHAIQNVLKTAKVTETDIHNACQDIKDKTGDIVSNHESFGGNWSVHAVLQTLVGHGYTVEPGVSSKREREWTGPPISELLQDETFRGMIIHQPTNRHFTCLRPEKEGDDTRLYYVDSQSDGPRRISPKLASRRCLAGAYSWEPFIIKGPEMERIELPEEISLNACEEKRPTKRTKRPAEEFMQAWYALKRNSPEPSTSTICKQEEEPQKPANILVVAGVVSHEDDDT